MQMHFFFFQRARREGEKERRREGEKERRREGEKERRREGEKERKRKSREREFRGRRGDKKRKLIGDTFLLQGHVPLAEGSMINHDLLQTSTQCVSESSPFSYRWRSGDR